ACSAACACTRYGNGTHTASAQSTSAAASDASRRAFEARLPFSFQLPTTRRAARSRGARLLPCAVAGACSKPVDRPMRKNLSMIPRRRGHRNRQPARGGGGGGGVGGGKRDRGVDCE